MSIVTIWSVFPNPVTYINFVFTCQGMAFVDSHGEDTIDVHIECDDLSEASSDMSSDDGEISQECWDGCSDDDM